MDVRDDRDVRAGRASCAATDAARSGVHLHRPRHARARHRPQHRDLLGRLRRAVAPAAVSRSRSARHHPVGAADRHRHQTFSTWAPVVVRRHCSRASRRSIISRSTRRSTRSSPDAASRCSCARSTSARTSSRRWASAPRAAARSSPAPPRPTMTTARSSATGCGAPSLKADPAIVGQTITIDGLPRTVVGVLPPDFSFKPVMPGGALPESDIFLPNRWPNDTGGNAFLWLLGPHETRRHARTRGSGIDGARERSVDAPAARPPPRGRGLARVDRPARVRHRVGAHAAADPARRGDVRAADRLRERREPADGAAHGAPRRARPCAWRSARDGGGSCVSC